MSEHTPPAETSAQDTPAAKKTRKQRSWPTGLIVRLFAYFVAGHILAGFLYLLFEIAPKS